MLYFSFYVNKVVEGSGSEDAPKYMGEGVTYRVFFGYESLFFMCVCHLTDHVRMHAPSVTLLHRKMMSHGTLMMSCHDVVMLS